ncbi:MAG: hypothetical protein KDJ65_00250 [Anaerolineae bacterium]|nr:hypothetical protein [Anaerolineae bacterium]
MRVSLAFLNRNRLYVRLNKVGEPMSQTTSNNIAEFIRTNPGYSAQVDLNLWFRDSAQNLSTMRRYKPIRSHRKAFEQVAGALDNKDKRVYLLTGNYGTGKSHLCLMLANFFAYPPDQPDVNQFLKNYEEEDTTAANKLRARRQKGNYLVALCDYDSTDDFGEVVLRAVLDPLKDAGLADVLDTPYEEARRKLEQLADEQKTGQTLVDYYGLFEQQLPQHLSGMSMNAFQEKLYPGMDRTALDVFKRMHHEILRSPFTYEAGNLSAILRSTLKSQAFLDKFEGIVVFWDEFGYTLGDPNRLSLNVFQQFAQLCAEFDPTRGKLAFISTAHRDFSAYAPAWAAADYSKISDRVQRVNLLPEGLEDVVGAIVSPDKSHPLWKKDVFPKANPIWSQWIPASKNSGIFDWLVDKPPIFRAKILEGIYPMHPMATYGVIELAREVASQNRTVFTFFSSEKEDVYEEGSYLWYINNIAPADTNGQLNFYTVDRLFDYFQTRLNTANPDLTPRAKERVSNYEASLTQLQRARNQNPMALAEIDRIERILRTMLVYDLIGIHTSLENIAFGLNAPHSERPVIESQLEELAKFGIVHKNPTTKLYEFRRSDIFDVDRAIEDYKREEGDKLGNLAVELNNLVPLKRKDQYLEAKSYNAQHNEDKRLDRRIVSPGDLATTRTVDGQTLNYFDLLEQEIEQEINKDGNWEGIALYVVCETQADITKSRDLTAKNPSRRVAVAIPTAPIAFKEAALNLKAIEYVRGLPEAESFSTQDNALVVDREKVFQKRLEDLRDQLLTPAKLTWLGSYGKALPVEPHRVDDAATKLMQQLYTRRSTFSHDDFNQTHDVRNFTKKHLSLVEAVNALLKLGQELTIDTKQPDNRGEKRYLQRCLYQRGALSNIRQQQGSIHYVEVERTLAKFEQFLPALADMIRDAQGLGEKDRLNLRTFINKYRQPPYGLGDIALSLLFATLLRSFGDTIKLKKDDAAIGDLYVADFEMVADILKGNYPDAFIKYREIQPGEKTLIHEAYSLFTGTAGAVQGKVTVTNAYDAVASWYEELPPIAQVESFYKKSENGEAVRFLEVLDRLRAEDPHAFILGQLQTVVGYDSDELVTPERATKIIEALKAAKDQIESTLERVQSGLSDGLRNIFNVQGNTWDDLSDGVRAWYNNLDPNQRSTTATWHNDASKPLVQLFLDLSNPRELFVDKLPERPSYGFGRVRSWNADLTAAYLVKIEDGVRHVEENQIKVPSPTAELSGQYKKQKETIFFSGEMTLKLSHSDPAVRIFVTDTGYDPISGVKERTEFQGAKTFDIHRLTQARRTNVTLKYVPQDGEGNWGVVEELTFMDETLENEIRIPKMLIKEGAKTPVKFVFPTDEAGFRTACRTFFEGIVENEVIDKTQLRQVVEEILDSLTSDNSE